jgi:hypothetical protein
LLIFAADKGETVPVEVLWVGAVAVVAAAVINVVGSLWQSKRTLRHSRALSERSELRAVIDEAAGHIDSLVFDAMNAIAEIKEVTREKSRDYTRSPRRLSRRANKTIGTLWMTEIEKLFAGIRRGDGLRARLEMRLGSGDQAVIEYGAALDGLRVIHQRMIDGALGESDAIGAEIGTVGNHMKSFRSCCFKLIGTELDD